MGFLSLLFEEVDFLSSSSIADNLVSLAVNWSLRSGNSLDSKLFYLQLKAFISCGPSTLRIFLILGFRVWRDWSLSFIEGLGALFLMIYG